jgi:hypothetical protein
MEAFMRGLAYKTVLVAALAGCGFLVTSAAYANDWDNKWDHDHWDRHHHEHEHVIEAPPPRRVVVERQPMVVERQPVIVAVPQPVYVAPAPVYSAPAEPSLNFNFNIPLR